jgi:hypothetical protein
MLAHLIRSTIGVIAANLARRSVQGFPAQAYWSAAMSVPVVDPFGRRITYLRVSVTDRCDFRCVYCMAEDMTFLPKSEASRSSSLSIGSRARGPRRPERGRSAA